MRDKSSTDPERQDRVADARKRLLGLMLAAHELRRAANPTIERRANAADATPLSFAQEGLWILEQLGLHKGAYNIPLLLKLDGDLNLPALRHAFVELSRRHEILRTRFGLQDDVAVQIVEDEVVVDINLLDWSDAETDEFLPRVQQLSAQEAQLPFDLAVAPLFRVAVLKLAQREHVLLFTIHHIISDGWSLGIFIRELGLLYCASRAGKPAKLAHLRVQYGDFAAWERRGLKDGALDEDLRYWKRTLLGAPAMLELPTDRPRPDVQTFIGAAVTFDVPSKIVDAIEVLGRQEQATTFMVLLAAFQIFLSRWSGQKDLIVGTAIAGRTLPQLEELIGLFANMLALRGDLSGNPSFRSFLRRTKEGTLEAYAHQSVPFEQVVQEVRPERILSRQPLVQVTLGLQNFPKPALHLEGLSWAFLDQKCTSSKFDLTLDLYQDRSKITGAFVYATDLFEQQTIQRMAAQFCTLLQSIVSSPDCPIHELPLLPDEERHRLVVEWNQTACDLRGERCVHQLFREQAVRTPDAIAVAQGERCLKYRELDVRSSQLARYLQSIGVGPDVVVALYVQRSPEMVIGMLAILKAGGAYLPLDVTHPRARILAILEDAATQIVLTMSSSASDIESWSGCKVRLDAESSVFAALPDSPPDCAATPQNLAYVIYTSGSTGIAKGVMVAHQALLNYILWAVRTYDPTSGEAIPISSPLAFDATATGLYSALLSGRSAILLPDGEELEGLEDLLLQPRTLSFIKVSPAHLNALGPRLRVLRPPCAVNMIVVGGEPLPPATVELWRSIWPQVRMFNQYGPTETVVACTAYEIPLCWQTETSIPIGRPVSNVQLYVLDERMQLVPIGAVGELYVSGAQLSKGYLGHASLTAERFIPNPFGAAGSYMYRTGDLVRYRPDGNLEYVGRADRQIKLRGYRIELGEIEAQLLEHPDVREAVVVAREDVPGDKRLVAYVVRRGVDPAMEQRETFCPPLREFIKRRVPEYMVPSNWMVLRQMPITRNGKVDRRALPGPQGRPDELVQYVAPRDVDEHIVASIWSELLSVDRVGVNDNFFELGGNSLHGVKLVTAIAHQCSVRLSAVAVFKYQTVAEMAELIRDSRIGSTGGPATGSPPFEEGAV